MKALYDIWEAPGAYTWHSQLHGYVGHFASRALAEGYIAAVKRERKRLGMK